MQMIFKLLSSVVLLGLHVVAAADTASSNTGAKVIPWTTADLTKTDFLIAADVEVASSNPSGVNLGTVMESIVRSNGFYFSISQRLVIDKDKITIKLLKKGSDTEEETFTYERDKVVSRKFSDVALWPNAVGQAFVDAKYDVNPDGTLRPLDIQVAYNALTRTKMTKIEAKDLKVGEELMYHVIGNKYSAAMGNPVIWETPEAGAELISPYSYTVLGITAKEVWLSDSSIERGEKLYTMAILNKVLKALYTGSGVVDAKKPTS